MMLDGFRDMPEPDPLLSPYDYYCDAQGDSPHTNYLGYNAVPENAYETGTLGLRAYIHHGDGYILVTIWNGAYEL